jgi:hypothetical protein
MMKLHYIHSTREQKNLPQQTPQETYISRFILEAHKKVQSSNPAQKWAYTKADLTFTTIIVVAINKSIW